MPSPWVGVHIVGASIGQDNFHPGYRTLKYPSTLKSSGLSWPVPGCGAQHGLGALFCHNTAVVDVLQHEKPKDPRMQELLREFLYIVCTRGFTPVFRKVGTTANETADYISRVHDPTLNQEFFKNRSLPARKPVTAPDNLFSLQSNW